MSLGRTTKGGGLCGRRWSGRLSTSSIIIKIKMNLRTWPLMMANYHCHGHVVDAVVVVVMVMVAATMVLLSVSFRYLEQNSNHPIPTKLGLNNSGKMFDFSFEARNWEISILGLLM